jgi:hypothetical protein
LASVLSASPFNTYVEPGYWIMSGVSGIPGIRLNASSADIDLTKPDFNPGISLLGNSTGFDSGSGAEFLFNAAGETTIGLFGALGGAFFSGALTSNSYVGPATAPSGSCFTNGAWVFSQDGHATFCASGTWVTKI